MAETSMILSACGPRASSTTAWSGTKESKSESPRCRRCRVLGSHLSDRLRRDGIEVIGLDNFCTGRRENMMQLEGDPGFSFFEHDITRPVGAGVAGPLDVIFNLACPASPRAYQRDPLFNLETNYVGTRNLLELAREEGATIFQASTTEVYGDPQIHPQTEDYWGNVNPYGPRACYDEGKRFAESLVMEYHRQHGLDVRIVRIFNTYGPRSHPERRPRHAQFLRPGPARRTPHRLRRRQPDPLLPVCRRPRRRGS